MVLLFGWYSQIHSMGILLRDCTPSSFTFFCSLARVLCYFKVKLLSILDKLFNNHLFRHIMFHTCAITSRHPKAMNKKGAIKKSKKH